MRKNLKGLFKINKKSIKEVLLWMIGGLFLLVITEYLLRGKIKYVKLLLLNKPEVFLVNYLLILLITSLIFILKRKKTFYFFISFVIVTLSGVSKYLCIVRGVPFTFSDLYSLGEALEIAGNYVNIQMVIGVLTFLLIVIGIIIFLFKKEKNNERITSLVNPLIMIILIIVFPIITKSQYDKGNMGYMRWDITASYKKNGYIFSTLESAVKYIRIKPEGYSKSAIEEIRKKVDEKEKQDKRIINTNKPNMIFIQLEGFMDPTQIKEANYSEDPIPNFRKICDKNKGYIASVPTTGGGTVRTEYEVMTGNNIDYLTPGEIPYNTSMEYMNGYEKNERGWVKDTILTKYIKKALDSTAGSDLIYTVTVQGHSAYPDDALKLYEFPIKISGNLSDKDKNQLYYYVNQLKETDDFIGDIMNMVDNSEEDTLVVFYSDHMPALNVFQDSNFYLDAYEAPFAFYSNFEIKNFDFNKTEAYNISSLAMKLAGVEYGPMEKFHTYLNDDENYEKYEELLEYDMLFGKNYYLKEDEKPERNTMKMGLEDVTITSLEYQENFILINGINFTENSAVYINNKKVETIFVDDKTLKIKEDKNGKTLIVKQLGRNDGLLSQSNSMDLSQIEIAKK